MLDPERDLKGATPETLARALLRNDHLRDAPRTGDRDESDNAQSKD
jgi:hypothetical protein